MPQPTALAPEQLFSRCDPAQFDFADTGSLPDADNAFGQQRAVEALRLALDVPGRGCNLFVLGQAGSNRHRLVQGLLEAHVRHKPAPADWCYVENFGTPNKPRVLRLPAGQGVRLKAALQQFTSELGPALASALESEQHRARLEAIERDFKQREEGPVRALGDEAAAQGIALLRTPAGLGFAPVKDGQPMVGEAFEALPDEEKRRITQTIEQLGQRLQKVLHELPRLRREMAARARRATREAIALAVGHIIDELKERFAEVPAALDFFDEVRHDVVESGGQLREVVGHEGGAGEGPELGAMAGNIALRRYEVNLLVGHDQRSHAPVVWGDHPTYPNLVGRIDHQAHMGTLYTNFTLIQPGAMHRANGGWLLLDAAKVLVQPYAWEGLKRTLRSGRIVIESLPQMLGWMNTVPLEPEPVPADLNVVLVGEREIYHLLQALDPEFGELFEIAADFNDDVPRDAANTQELARVLGTLARAQGLHPLSPEAVARVVEHAARSADAADRLTTRMRWLEDLLREAHALAARAGLQRIGRTQVDEALAARRRRGDRLRTRVQQAVLEDTLQIATSGAKAGQVNGLAVSAHGEDAFGHPVRLTATVRLGDGHVVDIEREAALAGPIHSKGVLILSSYLGARYAQGMPLSLSASIVFEQSYGMVEGDSASLAELCAILSALAETPVRQSLAVTGSINQFGGVQAVGGVNEKIEGFFDICHARGLSGEQGVLLPRSNIRHLMLRADVVDAAARGRFHIYPIDTVDQALALLTGLEAGEPDARGQLPPGSVNHRIATRLAQMSAQRQAFEMGLDRPLRRIAKRRRQQAREPREPGERPKVGPARW